MRFSLPLALFLVAATATADPPPVRQALRLGRPAVPVSVAIDAQGVLTVRAGGRRVSAAAPVEAPTEVSVERVEVADGHAVAVLRYRGEGQGAALVVVRGGAPRVLWSGRTDLHGPDPGERVADGIVVEDRTGDGYPDVVVGRRREGVGLCGQPPALLFPRAYDPSSGALRSVILRRAPAEAVAVEAQLTSPGPEGPPLLQTLRFTAESSRRGAGVDPAILAPPLLLTDGDPATAWVEGRGGPGLQELVRARFTARYPIRAFALRLPPSPSAVPTRLVVVGDDGALRVTLPADAPRGPRLWITPPAPLAWRCVALVIEAAEGEGDTALGEVEAYTSLDFGGGVAGLVDTVVEGGADGADAARLLASLGSEEGVAALRDGWERLDDVGRRRGVQVFSEGARRGVPEAAAHLAQAARDPSSEVREAAFEAFADLDRGAAQEALSGLLRDPNVGDEAVPAVLRQPADVAVPALLAALRTEGGPERARLRDALGRAAAAPLSEATEAALAAFMVDAPLAARVAAVRAFASTEDTVDRAVPSLRGLVQAVDGFAPRYVLAVAARQVGRADPPVDAWLGTLAASAEEWMLRAAALDALGRRRSDNRVEVARAGLEDAYPRVRARAVEVLHRAGAEPEAIAMVAAADRWPMVRAAALTALADAPGSEPTLVAALEDISPQVRVAALRALTTGAHEGTWAPVEAILLDDDEWPRVTAAALAYVAARCPGGEASALAAVLRRGLAPRAWAPRVDLAAVAAHLLLRTDRADEARALLEREGLPPAIRGALEREPPPSCGSAAP
jgi:HEAT repeat protein